MDRLRDQGDYGGEADSGWADLPDDDGAADARDVADAEPPMFGGDERRMQVRAYHFWARLLGDHNFPTIDQIDPAAQADFSDHGVMLDFSGGIDNPSVTYLGEALAAECGGGGIRSLADVPPRSLLSRITDHYLQIIANRAPIGFEAEFVNQHGSAIMYRGILLPFSSDGDTIDFIYGVINWKEMAGEALTSELELEISSAIAAGAGTATSVPQVWADGPAAPLDEMADDAAGDDGDAACDDAPGEGEGLAEWLASARALVDLAAHSEGRSRAALYRAIGRAYDVAVIATRDRATLIELLDDAGIRMQTRAPMTAIAKLVFGVAHDKTRLTEYATAMTAAAEARIALGGMTGWLESRQGGLKGVVQAARAVRRAGRPAAAVDPRAALRTAPELPFESLRAGSDEFVLLVARATGDGGLAVVGRAEGDATLIDRALKAATRSPQ